MKFGPINARIQDVVFYDHELTLAEISRINGPMLWYLFDSNLNDNLRLHGTQPFTARGSNGQYSTG